MVGPSPEIEETGIDLLHEKPPLVHPVLTSTYLLVCSPPTNVAKARAGGRGVERRRARLVPYDQVRPTPSNHYSNYLYASHSYTELLPTLSNHHR